MHGKRCPERTHRPPPGVDGAAPDASCFRRRGCRPARSERDVPRTGTAGHLRFRTLRPKPQRHGPPGRASGGHRPPACRGASRLGRIKGAGRIRGGAAYVAPWSAGPCAAEHRRGGRPLHAGRLLRHAQRGEPVHPEEEEVLLVERCPAPARASRSGGWERACRSTPAPRARACWPSAPRISGRLRWRTWPGGLDDRIRPDHHQSPVWPPRSRGARTRLRDHEPRGGAGQLRRRGPDHLLRRHLHRRAGRGHQSRRSPVGPSCRSCASRPAASGGRMWSLGRE